MKKFKAIVLVLIALSLTVSFVSCTKDNNPDTELPIADTEQTPNDNSNNSESLNVERMTLEEVKKIIAENDTYEEILNAVTERWTPDSVSYNGKFLSFFLTDSSDHYIRFSPHKEDVYIIEYYQHENLYSPTNGIEHRVSLHPKIDESKRSDERMTLEEVKKIIAKNDNYTEIVSALLSRQTPDATYGSGMTQTIFILNDSPYESIRFCWEWVGIIHTKAERLYEGP